MAQAMGWLRPAFVSLIFLVIALSSCSAVRPGGEKGAVLTSSGSIVNDDGTLAEEYELRESNPLLAHFVTLGSATHKLLHKSGYAYGTLASITHSDRDKKYGEGPEREQWFPMVIVLHVLEGGSVDAAEDVTVQYEVDLDYDPKEFAPPGLVILEARKLDADGRVTATLDVLPATPMSFLDRNRPGIMMMFGVIIASGVVKFLRRGLERLVQVAKQSRDAGEGESAASATVGEGTQSSGVPTKGKGGNPKKDKKTVVGGGDKED